MDGGRRLAVGCHVVGVGVPMWLDGSFVTYHMWNLPLDTAEKTTSPQTTYSDVKNVGFDRLYAPVGVEFVQWRRCITVPVRVLYRLRSRGYRDRLLILNHRTLERFPHVDVL